MKFKFSQSVSFRNFSIGKPPRVECNRIGSPTERQALVRRGEPQRKSASVRAGEDASLVCRSVGRRKSSPPLYVDSTDRAILPPSSSVCRSTITRWDGRARPRALERFKREHNNNGLRIARHATTEASLSASNLIEGFRVQVLCD